MDIATNISYAQSTGIILAEAGTSSQSKWLQPVPTSFEKWQVAPNPYTNTNKFGDKPEIIGDTDSRGKWGDLSDIIKDVLPATGGNSNIWLYLIGGMAVVAIIIAVALKKSKK